MSDSNKRLKAGGIDFALNLFVAANREAGENGTPLVISPLSAAIALTMLANGAEGDTRKQLISLLGAEGQGIGKINDYYQSIIPKLPIWDKTTKIKVTNSLWNNPKYPVFRKYTERLQRCFNAEIHAIEMSTVTSDINNWCERNTSGLIKDFFHEGQISFLVQIILLNALYFSSRWRDEFNRANTNKGQFTNFDRSKSQVSYMTKWCMDAPCFFGGGYTVLTMEFIHGHFSMQILLPDEGISLLQCEESINAKDYLAWASADECEVDIRIPKFSVRYRDSMKKSLTALGGGFVFSGGNFTEISDPNPIIDDVLQETVFSIDEDGVEAASVTAVVGLTSCPPGFAKKKVIFNVDRPFLYVLKDNHTDVILFIGRITKL